MPRPVLRDGDRAIRGDQPVLDKTPWLRLCRLVGSGVRTPSKSFISQRGGSSVRWGRGSGWGSRGPGHGPDGSRPEASHQRFRRGEGAANHLAQRPVKGDPLAVRAAFQPVATRRDRDLDQFDGELVMACNSSSESISSRSLSAVAFTNTITRMRVPIAWQGPHRPAYPRKKDARHVPPPGRAYSCGSDAPGDFHPIRPCAATMAAHGKHCLHRS